MNAGHNGDKSLSAFGNFYARSILRFPLRDVTTGYRMWRRETLQSMPLERISSNGYVFLVEMAYLAYCLEYRYQRSPHLFCGPALGQVEDVFQDSIRSGLAGLAGVVELSRCKASRTKSTCCVRFI